MERDPDSKKNGYLAVSYCAALEEGLLPITEDEDNEDLIFMQDNASIHTSNKAKNWLEEHGITLLVNWPPYSPDLNPIEHLWFDLKAAIYELNPHLDDIIGKELQREVLIDLLLKAWKIILTTKVRAVLESMPRRL
jgi:transposase